MSEQEQRRAAHEVNAADALHCLWMDAGVIDFKLCDLDFQCERCPLDDALHAHPKRQFLIADRNTGESSAGDLYGCGFAPDRFYHAGHMWARVEDDAVVRIGLDDFGQRMLGPVYSVTFPSAALALKPHERVCTITHQSGVTSLEPPVIGKIVSVNQTLLQRPALVNRDPYGEGWMLTIEPTNLRSCLRRLRYGERAQQWLTNEIEKVVSLIAEISNNESGALSHTMNDGGFLTDNFLSGLNVTERQRIISSFFPLSVSDKAEPTTAILSSQRR